jgi:hypothetical protein
MIARRSPLVCPANGIQRSMRLTCGFLESNDIFGKPNDRSPSLENFPQNVP